MSTAEKKVKLDIVSDVMCPWCFVGKRRLEKALKNIDQEIDVEIKWLPFQLDATLPPEGKDRQLYLSEKFGGKENAEKFYQTIKQAGDDEGIDFDFDAIEVSPNTMDAHRLIAWAGQQGDEQQDRIVELLFKAYFQDGKNIGDHAVLAKIAAEGGMDAQQVSGRLKSDDGLIETRQAVDHAHQIGVNGVPCFIFDGKYGVSGAQAPETLAMAIGKIANGEGL
ncbi:DsbA family oxidoreductase [Ahrensia marina]|uniref:DSBA oxidoreductase n=1 Tax=Ahrensia marina TaxID=1514904 RepID=A0A0N0VLS5_9HYPH|nr:DsbA family oxidoreductase [Ahrensia marina]KPB01384.1 DSBA oxidoreductase [Ahrensia marina]